MGEFAGSGRGAEQCQRSLASGKPPQADIAQGFATVSGAIGAADNYTRWILAALLGPEPEGHVLEVGVGHANYRAAMPGLERYVGVDVDPAVIAQAAQRWPEDRFVELDMCAPAFAGRIGQAGFDVVLCVNALQYAANEGEAIANMASVLRSGGQLAVLAPGLPALYGRMDKLAGHRRRYRRQDLRGYAQNAGLKVERLSFFNPVGALGWWANNLGQHRSLDDQGLAGQVALFDRFLVPISRAIDPLTRNWFGLSLVLRASKP